MSTATVYSVAVFQTKNDSYPPGNSDDGRMSRETQKEFHFHPYTRKYLFACTASI